MNSIELASALGDEIDEMYRILGDGFRRMNLPGCVPAPTNIALSLSYLRGNCGDLYSNAQNECERAFGGGTTNMGTDIPICRTAKGTMQAEGNEARKCYFGLP